MTKDEIIETKIRARRDLIGILLRSREEPILIEELKEYEAYILEGLEEALDTPSE